VAERGLGTGESPTVEDLDQRARLLLEAGRALHLLPDPEPWRGDATVGHPWAALLVAASLDARHPGDASVGSLLDRAHEEFVADEDVVGAAATHFVRGVVFSRRGCYDEAVGLWNRCLAEGGDELRTPQLLTFLSLESYLAGDLTAALARAGEGFGAAVEAGSERAAAWAALYLAMYSFAKGDLRRTECRVDEASARFERRGEADRPDGFPVLVALRAQLAALRGDAEVARRLFDQAEQAADELDATWYHRILLARRAESMALLHEREEIERVRRRLDALAPVGDAVTEAIVERSKGMAATAAGDPDSAEQHLERAIAMPASRIEASRARLALGELLVAFGDLDRAVEVLGRAHAELASSDSGYWQARALWLLARADLDHALRWEAMARTFDDGDVAYRVLFAPPGGLRISLMDGPAVEIGGRPIAFATRNAELSVAVLALAGPTGVGADELARHLWPAAEPERLRPRLRTMLWHVRSALGAEAWRLTRRDDRLVLDLAGAVLERPTDGSPVGGVGDLGRILEALLPEVG
jgi:tetratricopeptide (TPR) repeat protein